ncbi:Uncharacterised protein [Burkholderia pseudomallei]|nr:Uncharacterised protein [Burkholderia pseudomallei]
MPAGVRRWTYTYCTAADTTECPIVGLMLTATGPRTDLTQTASYSYYLTNSATNCGTPGAVCYQAGCHLPPYRSHWASGIKEPGRFRHKGATSFPAYRSQLVFGI